MRDAVICEPLRTPVGGFGGVFRDVPVSVLAATVLRELLARTELPPEAVDDVILGQGYPNGEAPAIGRVAALDAGLPVEVPGLQVDRRCGAGPAGDHARRDGGADRRRGARDRGRRGEHEPGRVLRDRRALGSARGKRRARRIGSRAGA